MTSVITDDATLPRYHRLGNVLQQRIEDGTYAVGSFLPTESELCTEFNVSRYTVREALRRLTDAGLLERRQGSGSQVIARETSTAFVQSMRSISGLFQYATDTQFDVRSVEKVRDDDELIGFLGGVP
ncbi:MAG: GntR family transcriptional regulator, partial [Pseudomonadota bacterium]